MHPILLDMDPGVDDALALILALRAAEPAVRAVTTVGGNVPVCRGSANALRVLELLGAAVPVYEGADQPLEGTAVRAEHVHGPSGLGEAQLPEPRAVVVGDAVDHLEQQLSSEPDGSLSIVATGPLTNLALVERRSPGALRRARQVVVMGGAVHEPGNSAPRSEFNFFADPMAAREVLHSGARLLLVPLDATRQVLLSTAELESLVAGCPEPVAEFVRAAVRTPVELARQSSGIDGIYLHDPLAVAVAMRPELGKRRVSHLDVETGGVLTRGQLVADERSYADPARRQGVALEWVAQVDRPAFMQLFGECLRGAVAFTPAGAP